MKFVILTSALVATIYAEEPPVLANLSVKSYYECGNPELIVDST